MFICCAHWDALALNQRVTALIQNSYTKAAFIALLVASGLSVVVGFSFFTLLPEAKGLTLILLLLTPLAIFINLFVAYKIYQGKNRFIKFAFWVYVVQIVGFDIGGWAFSLLLGFTFHISWAVGSSSITINFFAILMSVLLFKAMQSASKTS